jgi:predicted extracellular nuclease
MKQFALACLFLLVAASASAGIIHDIQTGLATEGTLQNPCDAVVTAVTYNGIWVAEAPYGAYDGIWVYLGSSEPIDFVPGDVVCICGEYKEYYGLSEIDVAAAGLYGSVIQVGTQAVPAPSLVTAAELAADPEMWESCVITITDGMTVVDNDLGFGEWLVEALDGNTVRFDDIFYDDTTVNIGDCYNNATGVFHYSFSNFKLEPFENGIALTDCSVDTEDATLSALKALYR